MEIIPILLIVLVLGSILFGIATPTESASLGALGSLLIAFNKGISKEVLKSVCIETLKINPDSRRMLVSAWNPSVLPNPNLSFAENISNQKAALPPCHAFFQFYVSNNRLSCQLYQRSADVFLGVPFNIASYALLTMMVAQVCNYKPGDFVHTFGDVHIYSNHEEQVKEQLSRSPKPLPIMRLNKNVTSIFEFTYSDFEIINYDPHPLIPGAVSI